MYKLMGGVMNWWELIAFLVQFACDMEMLLFPKDYLVQVFGPGVMEGYDEAIWLVRAGALTGALWSIGVFWFCSYSAFAPVPLFKTAIRQQAWLMQMGIYGIFVLGWGLNAKTHHPEGSVHVNYSNVAMKVENRGRSVSKSMKKRQ
eukprot:CAMPEP_0179008900 /NCGR_PEP_ID=MMETSP0795-20121207/15978_1 /TAXON_ID=88552 /ORGANISM="Amoebophrya sp., Strain Ameob2" /LENGTH=145 /DNA_ID=CAMNT_0020704047 /DNA_START=68 /DNA_END=505 /DNA_ORIENTATION=+